MLRECVPSGEVAHQIADAIRAWFAAEASRAGSALAPPAAFQSTLPEALARIVEARLPLGGSGTPTRSVARHRAAGRGRAGGAVLLAPDLGAPILLIDSQAQHLVEASEGRQPERVGTSKLGAVTNSRMPHADAAFVL
jgi:hypothetical protein